MADTDYKPLDQALEDGRLEKRGRYYYEGDEKVAGSKDEALAYVQKLTDDDPPDDDETAPGASTGEGEAPPGSDTPDEEDDEEGEEEEAPAEPTGTVGPARYRGEYDLTFTRPDGRTATLCSGQVTKNLPLSSPKIQQALADGTLVHLDA